MEPNTPPEERRRFHIRVVTGAVARISTWAAVMEGFDLKLANADPQNLREPCLIGPDSISVHIPLASDRKTRIV